MDQRSARQVDALVRKVPRGAGTSVSNSKATSNGLAYPRGFVGESASHTEVASKSMSGRSGSVHFIIWEKSLTDPRIERLLVAATTTSRHSATSRATSAGGMPRACRRSASALGNVFGSDFASRAGITIGSRERALTSRIKRWWPTETGWANQSPSAAVDAGGSATGGPTRFSSFCVQRRTSNPRLLPPCSAQRFALERRPLTLPRQPSAFRSPLDALVGRLLRRRHILVASIGDALLVEPVDGDPGERFVSVPIPALENPATVDCGRAPDRQDERD